jgi:AraC-like DNA-binding protein
LKELAELDRILDVKPRSILNAVRDWPRLAEAAHYRASKLAKLCRVSLKTLRRFVREQRRVSLRTWLEELQARKAEQWVRRGKRVKEIADALGYAHSAQFSRWFKRMHGLSPRVWRNLMA